MAYDYTGDQGINNYSSQQSKNMLEESQNNFSYDFKQQALDTASSTNNTVSNEAFNKLFNTTQQSTNQVDTSVQQPPSDQVDTNSISNDDFNKLFNTINITENKAPSRIRPLSQLEKGFQFAMDTVGGVANDLATGADILTFGLPKMAYKYAFQNEDDAKLTEDQLNYKKSAQAIFNAKNLPTPVLTNLATSLFSDKGKLEVMDYQRALTQSIIDELDGQGFNAHAELNSENDESSGWGIYVTDQQGTKHRIDDTSMLDALQTNASGIVGGIAGGTTGFKMASKITKNPLLLAGATTVGAIVGTESGNLADMLNANLKLNNEITLAQMKQKMIEDGSVEVVTAALAKPLSMLGVGILNTANNIKRFIKDGNVAGAVKEALSHVDMTREEALDLVGQFAKYYNIDLKSESTLASVKTHAEDDAILSVLAEVNTRMSNITSSIKSSDIAIKNFTSNLVSRSSLITEKLANADSNIAVEAIQKDLPAYIKNVKDYYTEVKTAFQQYTKGRTFDLSNLVTTIKSNIPNEFKDPSIDNRLVTLLDKIDTQTIPRDGDALINLKQYIGDFIADNKNKLSFDQRKSLENASKLVNNEIVKWGKEVPEGDLWVKGWETANKEYSTMKSLETNALYKALNRPGQSPTDLIKTFANYIDAADNTFFNVVKQLPKETRTKIDEAVMKHFVDKSTMGLGTDIEAIDFIKLNKSIKDVQFSSPDMIAHKNLINDMAKLFKNDKDLYRFAGGLTQPSVGNSMAATTMTGPAKVNVVQKMWNFIRARFPGQEGRTRALFDNVKRVFENPLDAKSYNEIIKTLPADERDIRNPLSFASSINTIRQTYAGTKAYQESMSKVPNNILQAPPLEAEVIDLEGDIYKNIKNQENPIIIKDTTNSDIIDAEWYPNQRLVITKDGHILPMEQLLAGERLPDNARLPQSVVTPIKNFFDMKLKLKTDPELSKASNAVKQAKNPEAKAKSKDRLSKLIDYRMLRDKGLSPADAHKAVYGDSKGIKLKLSEELTSGLIGGSVNGITIDADGELDVDTNKFMQGLTIGIAGMAGVKYGGKLYKEGEYLAMQMAGGGTPPTTINYNYKSIDALTAAKGMKFTYKDLIGFLKGKQVSEKEISQLGLSAFTNDNRAIPAEVWLKEIDLYAEKGGPKLRTIESTNSSNYSEYTLGTRGSDKDSNYKVTELFAQNPEIGNKVKTHTFLDSNGNMLDKYELGQQLGWIRTHTQSINSIDPNKKVLVLNEIQSDWAQAQRAGKGLFASTNRDELRSKANLSSNESNSINKTPLSLEESANRIIKLNKDLERFKNDAEAATAKTKAIVKAYWESTKHLFNMKAYNKLSDKIFSKELSIKSKVGDVPNSDILINRMLENDSEYQALKDKQKSMDAMLTKLSNHLESSYEFKQANSEITQAEHEIERANRKIGSIESNKRLADFPMNVDKFYQLGMVKAIDEALSQNLDTIVIPIERNTELAGTEGVTKFYESLSNKAIPEMIKKLKKQGLEIEYSRKPYSETVDKSVGPRRSVTYNNNLHVLKIVKRPSTVNWDVYKAIGSLGLGTAAIDEAKAQVFTKEDKVVNKSIKVPAAAIANVKLFEGDKYFHSSVDKNNTALYLGADLKNEDPEIVDQIKKIAGIKGNNITEAQSKIVGETMVKHRYGLLTKYGTFNEDTNNKLLNLAVFDNRLIKWMKDNKGKSPMNYIKEVANSNKNDNIRNRHTFTYISLLDKDNKATPKMVDIMLNNIVRGKDQPLDTILKNSKLIEAYKNGNQSEFIRQSFNAKYITKKDYDYLSVKKGGK